MTMRKTFTAVACAIGLMLAQPAFADGQKLDPFRLIIGEPAGMNAVIICVNAEKARKLLGAYGATGIGAMQGAIDSIAGCTVMAAFFEPRRVLATEPGDAGTLHLTEVEMRAPQKHAGNTYYLLTLFAVREK